MLLSIRITIGTTELHHGYKYVNFALAFERIGLEIAGVIFAREVQ